MFELVLIEAASKKHCQSCSLLHKTDVFRDVGVKQRQSFHILSEGHCQAWIEPAGRSFVCMPNKHCRTMVLLWTPLGSCHVQHTLLHILLACRVKWCLACFSMTLIYGWAVARATCFSFSHPKVWRGGSLLFHCQPQLPLPREDYVVPGDQTLLPTYTCYSGWVSAWPTLCRLGGCQQG